MCTSCVNRAATIDAWKLRPSRQAKLLRKLNHCMPHARASVWRRGGTDPRPVHFCLPEAALQTHVVVFQATTWQARPHVKAPSRAGSPVCRDRLASRQRDLLLVASRRNDGGRDRSCGCRRLVRGQFTAKREYPSGNSPVIPNHEMETTLAFSCPQLSCR